MLVRDYDSWLVEPYERAQEEWEDFLDWAEDRGFDTSNQEDLILAEQAYEEYCNERAEDWAIDAYEDYQDRLYDEMQEMDDYYDCYVYEDDFAYYDE